MNGKEILVDTNIIIYLLQGDDTLERMLQGKQLYVSFITELELYGFHKATKEYDRKVEALLSDCLVIPMNAAIMQQYRSLRKSHKLKLADSVVISTALTLNYPLVTADKEFKVVKALNLIQYER